MLTKDNGQHFPSSSQGLVKQKSTFGYRLVSPRCSTKTLFQELLDLTTSPLSVKAQTSVCWSVSAAAPPLTDDESIYLSM